MDAFARNEIVSDIRDRVEKGLSEQAALDACKSAHPEGPEVVETAWGQWCEDAAGLIATRFGLWPGGDGVAVLRRDSMLAIWKTREALDRGEPPAAVKALSPGIAKALVGLAAASIRAGVPLGSR